MLRLAEALSDLRRILQYSESSLCYSRNGDRLYSILSSILNSGSSQGKDTVLPINNDMW